MSTRSIIGTAQDLGFTGRYAHWDGYPSAKVAQLLESFADLGSWEAVRDYAIREGEYGYWSSFGSPSFCAEQAAKPEKVTCDLCNGTGVRTDGLFQERGPNCNGCSNTGQAHNRDRTDTWVANNGDSFVNSTDDVGAEWAYLLDESGIHVVAFLRGDGSKAVGAFGSIGDGYWASSGVIPWDADPETIDYEHLECGPDLEHCCHYAWKHFPEAEGTNVGTDVWLRRAKPAYHDIKAVIDVRFNVRYELTGSGSTGSARSKDWNVWDRPRYWWAEVTSPDGTRFDLRLFRTLKAGNKLEPHYRGVVPTREGELLVEPGTVL